MQNPLSSTTPSGTMPGISAVSPPARMQLQASSHSTMPAMMRVMLDLVDPADADVVEEEQRVAAGGEDVVDVHRHQILAGGFELAVLEQQFQLRAHAITAGDDDRFLVGAQIVAGGEQPEGLVQAAVFLGPLRAAPPMSPTRAAASLISTPACL